MILVPQLRRQQLVSIARRPTSSLLLAVFCCWLDADDRQRPTAADRSLRRLYTPSRVLPTCRHFTSTAVSSNALHFPSTTSLPSASAPPVVISGPGGSMVRCVCVCVSNGSLHVCASGVRIKYSTSPSDK